MNRTISIVIPTYNRYEMIIESFASVLNDSRVSEICIVDDCSTDNSIRLLVDHFFNNPKVHIYQNTANQDCYWNKRIAVEYSTNDWCIVLDSDNIITPEYIDALYAIPEWSYDTVYQPVYARPHFDFRQFSGLTIDKDNLRDYIKSDTLQTAFNAMNFFVNKHTYLAAFDPSVNPNTSDSIYMAYRLLDQGNKYYFVPLLEYDHRVGHPSHYTINNYKTGSFHQETLDKLYRL